MSISFIVTTYNIAPYIAECLGSLLPCLRSGDQLIIVDDGSDDETLDIIRQLTADAAMGRDIEITLIAFGTNTIGGVGIPGNIGLDHATRDTVFFVDGDDYLIPEGFLRARAEFRRRDCDILICNYLEFDQKNQKTKTPADQRRWKDVTGVMDIEALRMQALSMIAVPWRKFYKRSFLSENKLRFPEGDYFFEDNPFHWDVCRYAASIEFIDAIICHHRINRPGQTMASTGSELVAFFTHYCTIANRISRGNTVHAAQAVRWLLGNMSWHLGRLQPAAYVSYASEASRTLKSIDDAIWEKVAGEAAGTNIWICADRLRHGHVWDVVESWKSNNRQGLIDALQQKVDIAIQRVGKLEADMKTIREKVSAQQAVAEFEALKSFFGEK
jgi:glycosyltransferase involved in cell wall biosynthesis